MPVRITGDRNLEFTKEKVIEGVVERLFDFEVNGERVPGVVWVKEGASGPRPLVLFGHGGSQHKRINTLRARAIGYANKFGYACAAIDAPGHGDRISRVEAEALSAAIGKRVLEGGGMSRERLKLMAERSQQAIPEWKAALDALQSLDFVGNQGPVGYWGVSMGTHIGVPLVAEEPRITAAVFGLLGLREGAVEFERAANRIEIPVEFVFQWSDPVATREQGIALFDAFGSKKKTMHINPGGHLEIPAIEAASWEAFFIRHLGIAG